MARGRRVARLVLAPWSHPNPRPRVQGPHSQRARGPVGRRARSGRAAGQGGRIWAGAAGVKGSPDPPGRRDLSAAGGRGRLSRHPPTRRPPSDTAALVDARAGVAPLAEEGRGCDGGRLPARGERGARCRPTSKGARRPGGGGGGGRAGRLDDHWARHPRGKRGGVHAPQRAPASLRRTEAGGGCGRRTFSIMRGGGGPGRPTHATPSPRTNGPRRSGR